MKVLNKLDKEINHERILNYVAMSFLLLFMNILNLFDYFISFIGVHQNVLIEINPFMKYSLMTYYGMLEKLIAFFIISIVLFGINYLSYKNKFRNYNNFFYKISLSAVIIIIIFYTIIVINNIINFLGFN